MTPFLTPLLGQSASRHRIVNVRNGNVVADRLMTAFDSATRRTGLLSHRSMPPSAAMIIAPTNAIHTFFMKFPIDIAFVSRSGRVLKIRSTVPAWRMTASLRAYAVVELAAGALAGSDTKVGDDLVISAEP